MGGKMCLLWVLFCLSVFVIPCRSHSKAAMLKPSSKLYLPPNTTGPESIAFLDNSGNISIETGRGFYTSVSDGKILRYFNGRFQDFATTAPNRSKALCDGKSDPSLEPKCGRPLGLSFDHKTEELYIGDAYFGLMKVGSNGGKAQQLSTAPEGVRFNFANAVDIDPRTGNVYFVVSSTKYHRRQFAEAVKARDKTGRLLKYDPRNGKVTTLLQNLGLPSGLAVSKNGDFIIFSEFAFDRIQKYWLNKPDDGSKVLAQFPSNPDNIKRIGRSDKFWVAMNNHTTCFGQKINSNGKVLQTVIIDLGNSSSPFISEVNENGRKLYAGSLTLPYISVFDMTSHKIGFFK